MRSRGPEGPQQIAATLQNGRSGYWRTTKGREAEVGDNRGRLGLDFRVGRSRFLKGLHEANRKNSDLQGLHRTLGRRDQKGLSKMGVGSTIIMVLVGRCMIAAKRIIVTHKSDGRGGFFVGFKKVVGSMPMRRRMIYGYVELCTHAEPDGEKDARYDGTRTHRQQYILEISYLANATNPRPFILPGFLTRYRQHETSYR